MVLSIYSVYLHINLSDDDDDFSWCLVQKTFTNGSSFLQSNRLKLTVDIKLGQEVIAGILER